ncbi:hypothetical protein [Bacillus weihaiensis]|uniref:ABC transporter permease n=1 Tax=Bacillus weihaiensis TaxID=1547283 RepID=A0A1L3MRL4_9BACI|nr:hypothetical protein [Bacillus weihaiensis]APH04980.1 hypothetical protein A9C19_09590 [Bacillus weihaiensis]
MVRDAIWLAYKEIQFHRVTLLISIIVTFFYAGLTSFHLDQSLVNVISKETITDRYIIIDLLFMIITPSLAAIFMSKPYISFSTIKEDPYSKRMAIYRSLPISINTLALSRTIVMIFTLVLLSIAFYSILTFSLSDTIFTYYSISEYLIFICIWIGYALALGGLNTFIEYGTNGKFLHLFPYLLLAFLLLVFFLYYTFVEKGIVEQTILLSKNIGWPIAILSLFIGMVGCKFWHTLLTKRLSKKDFM